MNFSGWEKLSLVDFDNHIVTTLFAAGCNLRCPFCHNSELVLHPKNNPSIPWEEIRDYLKRRKGVIDAVVITGGEPTLMPDLIDKMKEIKSLGYEIKLDTNGTNPALLKELAKLSLVDYIAMDIKNSLPKYGVTIGIPTFNISKIEESIRFLIDGKIDYEFRTTIIDEFHTTTDMERIGQLIEGAKHYYLQRYIDSEYCIEHGFHEIKKEKALAYKAIANKYVGNVSLRGYE